MSGSGTACGPYRRPLDPEREVLRSKNNRGNKTLIQDGALGRGARHEVSLFVLVDVAVCIGEPFCWAKVECGGGSYCARVGKFLR